MRQLVRKAYAYGLHPSEVNALTLVELTEYVQANVKREREHNKFLTQVGYSTGVIASMALAKRRPKYEDVWGADHSSDTHSVELFKKKMTAWAANVNRTGNPK